MPATEQTWRDQKLMHRIFGVSGFLLLISTIWMFMADHTREWKHFQRTSRSNDLQQTAWRGIQYNTEQALAEHERLSAALMREKCKPIDEDLLEEFKAEVNSDAKRRDLEEYNFGRIDGLAEDLVELSAEASRLRNGEEGAERMRAIAEEAELAAVTASATAQQAKFAIAASAAESRDAAEDRFDELQKTAVTLEATAREARKEALLAEERATDAESLASQKRQDLIDALQAIVSAAKFREDLALTTRKFKSADVDAAKGALGLAVRDASPHNKVKTDEKLIEHYQEIVDELKQNESVGLEFLQLQYERAKAHRTNLRDTLSRITREVDAAQKAVDDNRADLRRLEIAQTETRSTYFVNSFPYFGKKWLELPILDAFSSPLTIDNLWDDENKIDYNFSKVRRFDRCTTCHQAMQKTMPGSAVEPAYVKAESIDLDLMSPPVDGLPTPRSGSDSLTLEQVYGIRLAEPGDFVMNPGDTTISFVRPFSRGRSVQAALNELAVPAVLSISAGAISDEVLAGDNFSMDLYLAGKAGETDLLLRSGKNDKSEDVLEIRTERGADPIATGPRTVATFVQGIGAAADMTGVTAAVVEMAVEESGETKNVPSIQLVSREKGADAFIKIEVLREPPGGKFTAGISSKIEKGRDLESSLGAQAILVSGDGKTESVLGDDLRRRELQPALVQSGGEDAKPGLMVGDVITHVNGDPVTNPKQAVRMLLNGRQKEDWGKTIRVTVRRGLPNPYITHPRLDLFLGSLSPHPMRGTNRTFACTICHDGQGSATAFKWASHAPNDPGQKDAWQREYGWFDNHHWIFPMYPKRFAESGCLKCHHDVTELEPSERFPEAPAPKVVHGYNLVRKFGCFGCHEIKGYDTPEKRVGPDLRLEPGYFAAAQMLASYLPDKVKQFGEPYRPLKERLAPLLEEQRKLQQEIDSRTIERTALQKVTENPDTARIASLTEEINKFTEDLSKLVSDSDNASLRAEAAPLEAHLAKLRLIQQLAESLTREPGDDAIRHRLAETIRLDAESGGVQTLDDRFYATLSLLKDVETPGTQRKVGPSLRYLAQKMSPDFLYDWVRKPKDFRPSTRMPQFFAFGESDGGGHGHGDHEHGDHGGESHGHDNDSGHEHDSHDGDGKSSLWRHLHGEPLEKSESYEPIEVLGIATYLMEKSSELTADADSLSENGFTPSPLYTYIEPEDGTEDWSASRGSALFQERGCLACHSHSLFEEAESYRDKDTIVQGPDLSGVGAKFKGEQGRSWLYSWVKDPSRYHPRTLMPNLFLDPAKWIDDQGQEITIDPAGDIVEFLLTKSTSTWKPNAGNLTIGDVEGDGADIEKVETLDEMVLNNLKDAFSTRKAEEYLQEGIPEGMRGELKGAEIELVGEGMGAKKKLLYLGRKSIGKYGCYACHDIPGFEAAKPIGTGLADWGRKDVSKLAFNHIHNYLRDTPGSWALHSHGNGDEEPKEGELDSGAHGFYHEAIDHGHRAGFIYQKLREPRSYDYHEVENKKYNERLRMPEFPLTDVDREAIITFVLGLVADPPSPKFVYKPSERQRAIQEGQQVLEKYNCAGCHILDFEEWDVAFPFGHESFAAPAEPKTFPFMQADFTPEQLAATAKPDRQGLLRATFVGLPAVGADGLPVMEAELPGFGPTPITDAEAEEEFDPNTATHSFELFAPAMVDGKVWQVKTRSVRIPANMIESRRAANGGFLTRYLTPIVAKTIRNPNKKGKGAEALGWVPPPLVGEGDKVQTGWLHDFLLDPYVIRPATVLRMPKFNMSSDEATKLANYFAALDNADYPYEFGEQRSPHHLTTAANTYAEHLKQSGDMTASPERRLADAMRIVARSDGCVQCHKVGDFDPKGFESDKAPNLADVYRRLRPEYVRRWVARPMQILPYTSMPENITYDPNHAFKGGKIPQDVYRGDSVQQLDAVVDLLMNFDQYSVERNSVAGMLKKDPAPVEENVEENENVKENSVTGENDSANSPREPE